MKKMLLLLAVCAFVGTTVQAQCTGKKGTSTAIQTSDSKMVSEKKACAATCASKLAAQDASIEKKVCAKSGKVSYVRNATCAKSGKVTSTAVNYDPATKAFVNASPEGSAHSMTVASGKKACSATAAAKLAANDASIEKKVCAKSGKVSYMRNATCAKSGKVTSTAVKYCSDSKAFVNASPEGTSKLVSAEGKKSCAASCASKLAAQDASIEKKVCAKSGNVSYVRNATCAKSGKVTSTVVNYDPATKAFVNASPEGSVQSMTVASGKKTCSASAAAKAASMDDSIVKRVCEKSGSVSYAKKATCAKSGKVSYTDVKYCSNAQAFVNASPEGSVKLVNSKANTVEGAKKACCSGKDAKACCGKKASKNSVKGSKK